MWKNIVVGPVTDNNKIWHMRIACWITKAADTHPEHLIHISLWIINSIWCTTLQCNTYKNLETSRLIYDLFGQSVRLKKGTSKRSFSSMQHLFLTRVRGQICWNIIYLKKLLFITCFVAGDLNLQQKHCWATLNIFMYFTVTFKSATTTYTECIAVSTAKCLRERASELRYTYVDCIVCNFYRYFSCHVEETLLSSSVESKCWVTDHAERWRPYNRSPRIDRCQSVLQHSASVESKRSPIITSQHGVRSNHRSWV
jgi:hypothetical protein